VRGMAESGAQWGGRYLAYEVGRIEDGGDQQPLTPGWPGGAGANSDSESDEEETSEGMESESEPGKVGGRAFGGLCGSKGCRG
jgi:hypothetical protein